MRPDSIRSGSDVIQERSDYKNWMPKGMVLSAVIAAGRCAVICGNVAGLPFEEGAFDLATAFETVYLRPGLEHCFAQVYRILKPGGAFMICNESDGTDETSLNFEELIEGMKCYTAEEISVALTAAGEIPPPCVISSFFQNGTFRRIRRRRHSF